jgi:hypothetical protein
MTYQLAFAALVALAACGERPATPSTATIPEQAAEAPASTPPPAESGRGDARDYAATPPPGGELPPSQITPGPIPLEFRHVWAIEVADCKSEPALTRIAIAPAAVKFYEGRSEVISLEQSGPRDLIMQVNHAAEGQTEPQVHTLKLNDAGTTLTYGRGGSSFTYTRCD